MQRERPVGIDDVHRSFDSRTDKVRKSWKETAAPRLVLADDNSAVLDHVSNLLRERTYEVVAVLRDGSEVVSECRRLKPDVVVLDIFIEKLSGLNVARLLRESDCRVKIIFLTIHDDPDFLNAAIGAGGNAFVVKSRVSTDLVPAIKAVLANKLFVSPSLLHHEP